MCACLTMRIAVCITTGTCSGLCLCFRLKCACTQASRPICTSLWRGVIDWWRTGLSTTGNQPELLRDEQPTSGNQHRSLSKNTGRVAILVGAQKECKRSDRPLWQMHFLHLYVSGRKKAEAKRQKEGGRRKLQEQHLLFYHSVPWCEMERMGNKLFVL